MRQQLQKETARQSQKSQGSFAQVTPVEYQLHEEEVGVRVISGSNTHYMPELVGHTIGRVREALRSPFHLSADCVAEINGSPVLDDDFVLQEGMRLEFSLEAGEKG